MPLRFDATPLSRYYAAGRHSHVIQWQLHVRPQLRFTYAILPLLR